MIEKEKLIEIIKKRFGTSDEDLQDLEIVMTALDGVDKADFLEKEIATMKLENEKALADLDNAWRKRYRDRFFDGDTGVEDIIDKMETEERDTEEPEEITLEDYLKEIEKESKK